MDVKTKRKRKKTSLNSKICSQLRIDKTKRQPTEWEKILSSDMTGKGLRLQKFTNSSHGLMPSKQTTQSKIRQKS